MRKPISRLSIKIICTLISACMAFSVLVFAVFAASAQNFNVGMNVGFSGPDENYGTLQVNFYKNGNKIAQPLQIFSPTSPIQSITKNTDFTSVNSFWMEIIFTNTGTKAYDVFLDTTKTSALPANLKVNYFTQNGSVSSINSGDQSVPFSNALGSSFGNVLGKTGALRIKIGFSFNGAMSATQLKFSFSFASTTP